MLNDFLFELGCEELPSKAVLPLADALRLAICTALDKAQIAYGEHCIFATPRRLAVLIHDVEDESPGQMLTKRGPAMVAAYDKEGQPTPALKGFAKSCGVELDALQVSKTDKGEWLVYESFVSGVKTRDRLAQIVQQSLATLPISKPMRWGNGLHEFARPVHWMVLLFGDSVIDADILGVPTDRLTYGHRFHAPQAVSIPHPAHYEFLLQEAYVIADFSKRRSLITQQISQASELNQAKALMPEALVDEVTSIVEWPQALIANFEPEFLEVPAEALIAAMQSHQKCFALEDVQGKLLPHFITITNIESKQPQQVMVGNEKVMRARLSDAAFFFNQDKNQPLSQHINTTRQVVFQIKLGSLFDKTERMRTLMEIIAPSLQINLKAAQRAVELSKCDLMTGMVGEFPELQGLMGYYYALHDGEAREVACALHEQYLPRFAGDTLPESSLGLALSLVDRLDILVGIFAINQKPTGDKDPFKLRRHALAIGRLLIENPVLLNLTELIEDMIAIYRPIFPTMTIAAHEIHAFIMERLQFYYQNQAISTDILLAVRACQDNCLYDMDKRVKALAEFVTTPESIALSAACKRVNNLLHLQEDACAQGKSVDETLFQEDAERALFTVLKSTEEEVGALYDIGDYAAIFSKLAKLRTPVDNFFERVMVMVEDNNIKNNRLTLLSQLRGLLKRTADISLLS